MTDAGAYWFGTLSCSFTATETQTDANGELSFEIIGDTSITGDIQTGEPGYINIEVTVSGIPINDIDTLACKSIDYEPDGDVDLADFVLFAQDFGGTESRSDFDWDGDVDLADFVMFAQHFGH